MTFTKSTVAYLAVLVLLFYAGAVYTFASPPGSPYSVGDNVTDPSCVPNSLNCYVNAITADNGLTATTGNIQLGGTLTQNTTIDQNGNNYTVAEVVPSTGGALVFSQGLGTVTGLPGTVQGYVAQNGDAARHISWLNTGDGQIHTLSGSGDPSISRGGTEITTSYDPTDTASGLINLYAFDTPNNNVTRLQVSPTHINFIFDLNGDLRLNGNPGATGNVLMSNGTGAAPTWQSMPISVNGSTLYSSGLTGTGSTSGNNIFLGENAGSGATGTYSGNFFGQNAGNGATGAWGSNFIGESAGTGATASYLGNFLGKFAGYQAWNARVSNFIGYGSGYLSTNAQQANFLGWSAGGEAPNASFSNFMGREAGFSADNATGSNFFGPYSGRYADNASNTNFIGNHAGHAAVNAALANFIGYYAGDGATNASNSIFIGQAAGSGDSVNNTGDVNDFSILIGKSTSTGGYKNSIALGGSAVNTASNQFMIGSATRPIDTLVLTGSSGNTCVLDVTVASPSCSSDETLKTNIADLSLSTLENVLKIKTVSYNWKNYPTKGSQIGFLAQDLEQYFPEVVSTAPNGFKTVSYGGMTPILVEALRELNVKVNAIALGQTPATVFDGIKIWLGDAGNGIENIFAKKVSTEQLCVRNANGETCLSRDDLDRLLQQSVVAPVNEETPPTLIPAQNQNGDPGTTEVPDEVNVPNLVETSSSQEEVQ